MKLNKDFMLREIAGEVVIIPTGEAAQNFNGMITVNQIGKFIIENAEKVENVDELVGLVLECYDVDEETARTDVQGFLNEMKARNMIEI